MQSEQEILMELVGNLAVVAGAILALVFAKDTITGVLGPRIVGSIKNASNALGKASGEQTKKLYDRTALGRGRALRKQAKEKYRSEKFADAMSETGRKGRLRRVAARGLTPVASRVPGFKKSAQKQQDYISRAAYGASAKADTEEVDFAAAQATSAAVATAARGGSDAKVTLQANLDAALARNDSVAVRAHIQALEGTGEQGIEMIRTSLAAADAAGHFKSNAGQGVKSDIMKHINAKSSFYKSKDVRLDRWKNTGDAEDLVNANYSGLDDEQIASQTRESLQSSNIDSGTAQRVLNNPDIRVKGNKRAGFEGVRDGATPAGSFAHPTPES